MTESQNWIQDKFNFLKTHIRRKGLSKSSCFKSPQRGASASAASAHDISLGSMDTDSMDTSIRSVTTHHPSICSTASSSLLSQPSSVDQQVMDKFSKMKTMLTSPRGPKQETTRTAFWKYLASEVENLEERDLQTFRIKAVKLSSRIQGRRKDPSATATYTF